LFQSLLLPSTQSESALPLIPLVPESDVSFDVLSCGYFFLHILIRINCNRIFDGLLY
jgi:hypothetical protein